MNFVELAKEAVGIGEYQWVQENKNWLPILNPLHGIPSLSPRIYGMIEAASAIFFPGKSRMDRIGREMLWNPSNVTRTAILARDLLSCFGFLGLGMMVKYATDDNLAASVVTAMTSKFLTNATLHAHFNGIEANVKKEMEEMVLDSPDHIIKLKRFTPEDAPEIFDLIDRNREHLSQFGDDTASKYPTSESVYESIINPTNPNRLRYAIRHRYGELLGSINLTPNEQDSQMGEIGYYLDSRKQGFGYMGRAVDLLVDHAFNHLRYKTLYAVVANANHPSINVLEKTGFTPAITEQGKTTFFLKSPYYQ